jgi:nucleoside recognition membrane protein YjiH
MIWGTIATALFDFAKDYFKRKKEIIDVKHETKIKAITAKQEWENKAVDGMAGSWKDELWTLFFVGVLIACFIPDLKPYIEDGFYTLRVSTPEWFQWALLMSIGASFGIKMTDKFKR